MKLHRTLLLSAFICGVSALLPAADEKGGEWESWFANNSLDGFEIVSGACTYEVKDGVLTGTTAEGSENTFLKSRSVKDFELTFEVKVDDELNSGVQVRSKVYKKGDPIPEGGSKAPSDDHLYGPQCEIAVNGTAGDFYDEARRGKWWREVQTGEVKRTPEAEAAFKKGEWNKYRILVVGDHYQSWVNGVPTADFKQPGDPDGSIGFQVHSIAKGTGPYQVHWRDVKFREIK